MAMPASIPPDDRMSGATAPREPVKDRVRRRFAVQFFVATLIFMTPLLLLPLARASQPDAWQPLGLRGQTVLALALTSRNGQRVIYAETSTGLWRLDQGGAWQQIDAGLPRAALGGPALAAWRNVPGRPQQLYALTESGTARQLYRSDDGGAAWLCIGPAPGQTARPAMVILPGLSGPDLITVSTGSRAQRSTDGGATWAPGGLWPEVDAVDIDRNVERVRVLLGESSSPDRLYALANDGGLWMSESAGLSWRTINPVMAGADAANESAPVSALAIAPYFGIRIWAATDDGLALSADNGATWTTLPLPVALGGPVAGSSGSRGRIVALRNDPRVPETIYAALTGGAVHRSDDSGATWAPLGVPGARHVTALAVDPDSRGLLYAATDDGIWVRAVAPPLPTPLPTPTQTMPLPTETPTYTPLPTQAPTSTPSPTATLTPSPTVTSTAAPTATATRRPTLRPTATRTVVPTVAPTRSADNTPLPGPQPTRPTLPPTQSAPPTQPVPFDTPTLVPPR